MLFRSDAFHSETFFGYAYDAGDHCLREYPPPRFCSLVARLTVLTYVSTVNYRFKEDPDPAALPEYGDATAGDGDMW